MSTPHTTTTPEATAMAITTIPERRAEQESRLLLLPAEILTDILGYACKHSSAIQPDLWLGTSKFACNWEDSRKKKENRASRAPGAFQEALTVVPLRLTCRLTQKIIDTQNLFYKLNDFQFDAPCSMLDYIKALSTQNRNTIENIHFHWEGEFDWEYVDAGRGIKGLSLCGGLRNLEIDVSLLDWWFHEHVELPFRFEEMAALRGLKSFKLQYDPSQSKFAPEYDCPQHPELVRGILRDSRRLSDSRTSEENNMELEIKELEDTIREQVTKARGTADLPSASEIAEILSCSTVVDGDYLRSITPDKKISTDCNVVEQNVEEFAAIEAYLSSR